MKNWWEEPAINTPTQGVSIADELHFPGYNGIPFRGKPFMFQERGAAGAKPKETIKTHVDIFDLSKPEDLAKYEKAIQIIANGFGALSKEDMQYDDTTKNWRVLLRWGELFAYNPHETPEGLKHG